MTITAQDWASIAPALVLLGAGILILFWDLLRTRFESKVPFELLSFASIGVSLWFLLKGIPAHADPIVGFGGTMVLDNLAVVLSLAILAGTGMLILLVPEDLKRRKIDFGEFYALVLFASAGMMLLVEATDLITIFLTIEMLSLAVYILTGMTRLQPRSAEAAMKYFITGAFATGFLLYGMTLLYGASGTIHLSEMAGTLTGHTPLALAGLTLMLVGFGFKVGAVPFHMWVPDVYEGAPTPVTAFMSVTVKAAGFGALIRILLVGLPGQAALWGDLLWGLAAVTMIVGNLMAVPQRSVKRMLAYSSIAHTGYILLGLAALKSGAVDAGSAAVYYLFVYTFMTFGAFAICIYLGREVTFPGRSGSEWHDAEDLTDFAGIAKERPWTAAAMTLFMLSLAGIPPLAGFTGKFLLFKAAIQHGYYWLAIIGVLMSIVSVYYYLRVVIYMYMKDPLEAPAGKVDAHVGAAVTVAALLTVALGFIPGSMVDLSLRALTSLVGP